MTLKPVVEAVLKARLRRAAIFVIVGLLLWSYNAYGIEFTIKDNLTDDMFGTAPKGTVDAVVMQAANFWITRRLGYTLREVAAYFRRDIATVATLLGRMEERMARDEELRKKYNG